jgi:hypothetical protein
VAESQAQNDKLRLNSELTTLEMKPDQTIEDFGAIVADYQFKLTVAGEVFVGQDGNPDETRLSIAFIDGISDELYGIHKILAKSNVEMLRTLDMTVQFFISKESELKRLQQRINQISASTASLNLEGHRLNYMYKPVPREREHSIRAITDNRPQDVRRCWNCDKSGHIQKYCPFMREQREQREDRSRGRNMYNASRGRYRSRDRSRDRDRSRSRSRSRSQQRQRVLYTNNRKRSASPHTARVNFMGARNGGDGAQAPQKHSE